MSNKVQYNSVRIGSAIGGIIVLLILFLFASVSIRERTNKSLSVVEMPTEDSFVEVKADSLTYRLEALYGDWVSIKSSAGSYSLSYNEDLSILVHENTDYTSIARNQLGLKEKEGRVTISMDKKDGYVKVPGLLLAIILNPAKKRF